MFNAKLLIKVENLTPNITSEAPVRVAECPPLGAGGTPSIYGKAQSHFLSTISQAHYYWNFFKLSSIEKSQFQDQIKARNTNVNSKLTLLNLFLRLFVTLTFILLLVSVIILLLQSLNDLGIREIWVVWWGICACTSTASSIGLLHLNIKILFIY